MKKNHKFRDSLPFSSVSGLKKIVGFAPNLGGVAGAVVAERGRGGVAGALSTAKIRVRLKLWAEVSWLLFFLFFILTQNGVVFYFGNLFGKNLRSV